MTDDDKATADQAVAEGAFAGGFGDKAPEVKSDEPKLATEAPPAEEKKDEPKYVQITEAEWNRVKAAADKTDAHDKQFSTVFGTVGRFEQLVKQVRDAQSEATGKLSSVAFDKLKEQFPELAEMTREAVQNALAGKAPEVDKTELDRIRQERVQSEMEALEDAYPDWKTIVNAAAPGQGDPNHPFRKWLATKDETYQTRVANTQSAAVLSRAIGLYEKETKAPPKPPEPPRDNARAARIRDAVQPRGDGGPPASSNPNEDAFAAAFNS